jgi:uncharacterized small protein (DUF1192 family)
MTAPIAELKDRIAFLEAELKRSEAALAKAQSERGRFMGATVDGKFVYSELGEHIVRLEAEVATARQEALPTTCSSCGYVYDQR